MGMVAILLGIMVHTPNGVKVLNELIRVKHSEKLFLLLFHYYFIIITCLQVTVCICTDCGNACRSLRNCYLHIWGKFIDLSGVSNILKGSVPAS